MGKRKPKLNLTVAEQQQKRAAKLAEEDHRSVSSLFESLVDEEWNKRHGAVAEESGGYGNKPGPKDKPPGTGPKKIGFGNSLILNGNGLN